MSLEASSPKRIFSILAQFLNKRADCMSIISVLIQPRQAALRDEVEILKRLHHVI